MLPPNTDGEVFILTYDGRDGHLITRMLSKRAITIESESPTKNCGCMALHIGRMTADDTAPAIEIGMIQLIKEQSHFSTWQDALMWFTPDRCEQLYNVIIKSIKDAHQQH